MAPVAHHRLYPRVKLRLSLCGLGMKGKSFFLRHIRSKPFGINLTGASIPILHRDKVDGRASLAKNQQTTRFQIEHVNV